MNQDTQRPRLSQSVSSKASKIIKRIVSHARDRYIGLSLIDGSGFQALYEKVGFTSADPTTDRLMYWQP